MWLLTMCSGILLAFPVNYAAIASLVFGLLHIVVECNSIWLLTSFSVFRTNLISHLMHKNMANRFLKKFMIYELVTQSLTYGGHTHLHVTAGLLCGCVSKNVSELFRILIVWPRIYKLRSSCLVYLNSIQSTQKLLFIEISRFFVTLIRSHSFSNILMYAELSSQTMTTTTTSQHNERSDRFSEVLCMHESSMNVPTRAIMLRLFRLYVCVWPNADAKCVRKAQHVCLQANDRIIVSKNLLRIFQFRARSFL